MPMSSILLISSPKAMPALEGLSMSNDITDDCMIKGTTMFGSEQLLKNNQWTWHKCRQFSGLMLDLLIHQKNEIHLLHIYGSPFKIFFINTAIESLFACLD